MKQFILALVVTVALGGILASIFRGDRLEANGQASAMLAAAPDAPPTSATAIAIATKAASSGGAGGAAAPSGPGADVAKSAGCAACHSTGGASGVGPTWKGIAGAQVTLADGSTATRDDAYLKESITTPNAKVVKGFSAGIMPQNFGTTLKPEQIDQLVEYIKSLK